MRHSNPGVCGVAATAILVVFVTCLAHPGYAQAPKAPAAGPVSTANTLTAGTFYGIEVSGTYSAYLPANWARTRNPFLVCGTSDASPALPSPGRVLAPAGQDAEWLFARPWKRPCPHQPPFGVSLFQVDSRPVGGGKLTR